MDEWNYWYGPHVFGEAGRVTVSRTPWASPAGLHEYFRNSDIIDMANYAQTVNVIGCIKTTKTHADFDCQRLSAPALSRPFWRPPVARWKIPPRPWTSPPR